MAPPPLHGSHRPAGADCASRDAASRWPRLARARLPLVALGAALLGVGLLACDDTLAPRPTGSVAATAPIARVTVPSDSDLKAQESVASHTQTITVNWDGSLTGAGDTGHTWYMETIYLASITGAVTAHGDPGIPTQTFVYGPCDPRVSVPFIRYSTPYNWNTHEWNACGTGPNAAYTYTYAYPSVGYAAFLMDRYYLRNCAPYTSMWWNCHTFSGGYTLTMTRVDADLAVAPSDTTIAPGGTATVRWTALPDSMGGRVTPVTVRRTFFEPDPLSAGGVASDSTKTCAVLSGSNSCTISPQGSGTLHLWAFVNGKLVHRTTHVNAVRCPVGDTTFKIIDNSGLRSLLDTLWKLSKPTDSIENRREHGGYLFDSAGVYTGRASPPSATDSPCSNGNIPSSPYPGALRWMVHTHPFSVGDTLPDNCKSPQQKKNGSTIAYGPGFGGPSGPDWNRVQNDSSYGVVGGVVMDVDSIYVFDAHSTSSVKKPDGTTTFEPDSGWMSKVRGFARKRGTCTIP